MQIQKSSVQFSRLSSSENLGSLRQYFYYIKVKRIRNLRLNKSIYYIIKMSMEIEIRRLHYFNDKFKLTCKFINYFQIEKSLCFKTVRAVIKICMYFLFKIACFKARTKMKVPNKALIISVKYIFHIYFTLYCTYISFI